MGPKYHFTIASGPFTSRDGPARSSLSRINLEFRLTNLTELMTLQCSRLKEPLTKGGSFPARDHMWQLQKVRLSCTYCAILCILWHLGRPIYEQTKSIEVSELLERCISNKYCLSTTFYSLFVLHFESFAHTVFFHFTFSWTNLTSVFVTNDAFIVEYYLGITILNHKVHLYWLKLRSKQSM